MFWILRRTGAVNFFNSINNNYSAKSHPVNVYNDSGKNNSRQRFRYGRLSVDSDDQNCNKPDDANATLMMNGESMKYTYCDSLHKNQCVDKNGNCESAENLNNFHTGNARSILAGKETDDEVNVKSQQKQQIDQKAISRLEAMAMSDDDDYDESLTCNVCDRAFHCHRQLTSHQQKKRHFGCSGCDTLFPSLMLMEHHKEEYEHWSDSEEYQRPCCRRNRRDDFDYSDSETCTSDAESEDLERLL